MPRYEYQFGVFVDAANEQAAWEKVRPISEALDKLDAEGESATDFIGVVTEPSSRRASSPGSNNLVFEALAVDGIKTAHFFTNGAGTWSGVAFDKGSGVEFDVRQTQNGWNVNDDNGRDFERSTLGEALRTAIRAQQANAR